MVKTKAKETLTQVKTRLTREQAKKTDTQIRQLLSRPQAEEERAEDIEEERAEDIRREREKQQRKRRQVEARESGFCVRLRWYVCAVWVFVVCVLFCAVLLLASLSKVRLVVHK
jgi:hypothetical protein